MPLHMSHEHKHEHSVVLSISPGLASLLMEALDVGRELANAVESLAGALGCNHKPQIHLEGAILMQTIPDNTPNIKVGITPAAEAFKVDAEHHRIPGTEIDVSGLRYLYISDDEAGVKFVPAADSPTDGGGNPLNGEFEFGGPNEDSSPRTANVRAECQDADGKTLQVLASETYVITVGAEAGTALSGASASFADPTPPTA